MTPQILTDSFEALVEVGAQTAKQTKQAAASVAKRTVNEVTADRVFSEKAESGRLGNHTPLAGERMKKLEEMYKKQDGQKEAMHTVEDEQKMEEVKGKLNSFFKEYKQKEEAFHERRKQEEEMQKRQENQEKVDKEREEQEKKAQSPVVAPKGKVRRNIFQRAIKSSQAETRVGTGGK